MGKCVYVLNFGHERTSSTEDDLEATPVKEELLSAMKLEVKLLVQIFEQVVAIMATTKSSRSKLSKPSLILETKERLQATMIRCIFGDRVVEFGGQHGESSEGSTRTFIHVIRRPVVVLPPAKPVNVKEVDVAKWLENKVWKAVGSDLMCRAGGW